MLSGLSLEKNTVCIKVIEITYIIHTRDSDGGKNRPEVSSVGLKLNHEERDSV